MKRAALAAVLLVSLSLALATAVAADSSAEQITWAVHTTLVDEPGLGLIAGYAFSAPYEDVKLKAQ